MPRRMIALGEFNRRIGHIATAPVAAGALRTVKDPGVELGKRIAWITLFDSGPQSVHVASDVPQAGGYQLVLRAKVTIERHLVRAGLLGDRVDADPLDA